MVPVFDPQVLEILLYERTLFEISFRSVRKKRQKLGSDGPVILTKFHNFDVRHKILGER
jgi:hypothetical protein